MKKFLACLILAVSSSAMAFDIAKASEWESVGFKNVQLKHVTFDDSYRKLKNPLTHAMKFVALVVKDGGWEEEGVRKQLSDTAEMYASRCGLWFNEVVYIEAELKQPRATIGEHGLEYDHFDSYAIGHGVPEFDGITNLFLRRDQYGGLRGNSNGGRFIRMFEFTGDFDSHTRTSVEQAKEQYSVLAHELTHVLTNEGNHYVNLGEDDEGSESTQLSLSKTNNILMYSREKRRNVVSWDQCRRARGQPYVKRMRFKK